jgi:hypothetical protein
MMAREIAEKKLKIRPNCAAAHAPERYHSDR